MRSRILANLGFLLQIAGLLTVLPILVGLFYNEEHQLISLLLTCVGFLGFGFLMNALSERKELDFKSGSALFLAAFIILPLIGAIPYIYTDPFNSPNVVDRFTNGYFESISGFTTTGFSFIQNSDALPTSLLFYRSLTELMGGVGIVFLFLAFFHSRKSLNHLSDALGVDNLNGNLKKTFFSVFAVYVSIIIIFTVAFFFLGFQDLLRTGSFMIDTITGGFQPSIVQFQQYLSLIPKILLTLLMFFGSVNFAFNYHLFTLKPKKMLSVEVGLYLIIIAVATGLISLLASLQPVDSLFHVVSMSSSTGFDYVGISSLNSTALSVFLVIMLIGGCAFSMAGGIRVSRLVSFGKSVKQSIKETLIKESTIHERNHNLTSNNHEYLSALVAIVLFIFTLVIFAVIFQTIGVSFIDALFEVGSALTTNGFSMGVTTVSIGLGYKWLMIVAMIIGRVEIMSVIIALCPYGIKGK